MQLGQVVGHATATVKHPTLTGWRMLLVQPLGADDGPDGDPVLAIDDLGCRRDDRVLLSSDGKTVREMMRSNNTPVRWFVMGLADE